MTIKAKPKQKIFKEVVVGDITDHVIYPPEEEEEKEEETALEEVRQVHEGARESTNLDLDKEANEHVKMDSDNDQGETLGCSFRFLRKVHFYMSFYSIAFVLLAIQCLTGEINRVVLPIAYAEVACFFLVVAFLATDHFYDLWTLDTKRSVFDIASRMYETTPMVTWYIQCYHYERREGQQQRVRVNTHCAKAELRYSYWKDTSPLVNLKEVIRYSLAKVTVEKSWSGDYGTQLQKKRFLSRNKHDTHYEFIETMELLPYDHCPIEFLAWANLSVRSCLVHWAWYLLFHLIIVFTVPYRMYLFGFSTTIVEVKIHKQLFTYENPPTRTK